MTQTQTPLRVVTINGSYSSPSKTGAIIDLVTETLADHFPIVTTTLNLMDLRPDFALALTPDDATETAQAAFRAVENADLIVAGSPVFKGSYSGLFKHFFDLLDTYALANKPVFLVATGGSERHALVIEHSLRPLFGFLQAHVAPVGIYATAGDFDGTLILNPEVYARTQTAVADLLPLLRQYATEAEPQVLPQP
jgi:FMN reductase